MAGECTRPPETSYGHFGGSTSVGSAVNISLPDRRRAQARGWAETHRNRSRRPLAPEKMLDSARPGFITTA
jgi:hypothetical protein